MYTAMDLFIAGVVRHVSIRVQARSRKQGQTLELDIEVGVARGLRQQVPSRVRLGTTSCP